MMNAPFFFGPQGQQLTPGQVKIMREMAAQKAAQMGTPSNLGEGLSSVGTALLYNSNMAKANEAESAGQAQVAQALAEARANGGSEGYYDVLSNPWATEGQRLVAGSLLDRGYALEDRQAQWDREDFIRQDERDFNQPVRELQIDSMGIQNETGQFSLDQARQGYTPLVSPEDRAKYGISPKDTSVWYVGPDGRPYNEAPSGGGVTINTGDNSSKFQNKADELAAARMDEIVAAGSGAQTFLGDIQMLSEIGKSLNTGKGAQVMAALGPFAEMVGIEIEGLPEAQAYDAIVSRLAPAMRPPGSGASSDFDAKQFLKSLPSLGNTPEGNAIIIETFSAIQQTKQAAAEIASMALSGQISWQEADRQIRALGNPFESFNKYRAMGDAGEADQAFRVNSDAEYDALPSGAIFIGPDGKKRRKP